MASPLQALRYRNFRLFWTGQLISIAGTQMRLVAINWQIYELTQATGASSELALGAVGLMRFLPLILCAPLSGLVADRVDRRRLLALVAFIALLCSALLGLLSLFGHPPL